VPLLFDRIGAGFQIRDGLSQKLCGAGQLTLGSKFGNFGAVVQPSFEDAAGYIEVEFAATQQEPGEQVQSGVLAEVADRGGIALAYFDESSGCYPFEGFTYCGAGYAEHFGKAAFAG
jgi:hypothetical protein